MMNPVIEGYALSRQQRRLWLLSGEGGGRQFQTTIHARAAHPLDPDRLAAALALLANRYDILRTRYESLPGGGSALQVVDPAGDGGGDFSWSIDGAAFRWTLPAIAADARSAKILIDQLALAYSGGTPEGADVQYLHYSEYQNDWIATPDASDLRNRWAEFLAQAPAAVLPGLGAGGGFSSRDIAISSRDAENLSDATGIGTQACLLAAWEVLVARFCGQTEFRLGFELDGRAFEELQTLPGPFERLAPLAAHVKPGIRFADLALRVQADLEKAFNLQDGFEESDASSCREDCRIAFTYVEAPAAAWDIEWVRSCSYPFNVRLNAFLGARGLDLRMEYDASAFREEDAQQCARSFSALLKSLTEDPQQDVYSALLMEEAQNTEILRTWSGSAAPPPDTRPVHERFRAAAERVPDAIALMQGDRVLTFGELDARSDALAGRLVREGVRPDSFVGIYGAPSIAAVVGILGVLKSSAAYVPIDPSFPRERIAFLLRDADVRIVLAEQRPAETWVRSVTLLDPIADAMASQFVPAQVSPRSSAYAIYTSGSTGQPKGVVIDHAGLAHYLDWCESAYAGEARLGAPLHSSLAFDLTVTSLFAPLITGRTVVIPAAHESTEGLSEILNTYDDFAWIKLTPGHARLAGRNTGLRNKAKLIILGGEALMFSDVEGWLQADPEVRIVNEYGPTEAVVGCCVHTLSVSDRGAVPIGRPIRNARLYVLDGAQQPVPPGVTGELYIGGSSLARGYLNQPALTARSFLPDPFSAEPGARLYRTGDLARFRHDGILEYAGRCDHQVKIRGHRVELGEIEAVLATHGSIGEAAALLRDGNHLVAYNTLRPGASSAPIAELRDFLAERLPEYMIPSTFVTLPVLPLTRNGKVDRAALPPIDGARSGTREGPRNLEEEVLAEIWGKVLGIERVAIDDDYFVLGGDSIRAIQIAGHAHQRGIEVTVAMLFRHRTIRDLVREVRTQQAGNHGPLAPEPFCLVTADDRASLPPDVEDAYPLSALQAGMIFHRELHPESAIYHDIFGYHLRMPLDVEKLDHAARALVERHPALRTAFHLSGLSEPLQVVHRAARSPLHVEDISHLNPEEQDQALQAWMEQEKRRGFDYLEPPLLRFQIHVRAPDSFQFSLSFHHAIIDGWSDATMLVELAVSYQCLLDGKPIPYEGPKTRYREFVALEREALRSGKHRQFWKDKLHGCKPLFLPRWQQVAPDDGGVRGVKLQHVPLSKEISDAFRQLARELAVPLKSVLLAAHMRVMSFLGGTTDVVTSLSSAGRPETLDANQVLGLHLNSTPIRLRLEGGRWIDLIQEVFREEQEALPFRRYPLAEVQKLTGVRRLSETSFYYTHYHNIERLAELPRFEILGRMVYEETSFAMVANFNLDPFTGVLGLTLACDQTQFAVDQRQWLGDHYEKALRELAADAEARYEGPDPVQPGEWERIVRLSGTAIERANPAPIHSLIAGQARRTPDALAVVCGSARLTYADLIGRAGQLATRLRAAGAGPDGLVGLCLDRSVDLIAGILGILQSGAAYLPLDPEHPEWRLQTVLGDAKPCAVVTEERHAARFDKDIPVIRTGDPRVAAGEVGSPVYDLQTLAYVIYTSGSTGRPKGTWISHENLFHSTAARFDVYTDRVRAFLLLSPYAFDSSVAGIFWTLATGGTLVVPEGGDSRSPEAIVRLLSEHRVSHVLALPSMYQAILDEGAGHPLPDLQTVIVAGESCAPRLVNRHFEVWPAKKLFNEYGPTEATVWATVQECRPVSETGSTPIGRAIPGARVYVADHQGRLAPLGVMGELYIGGRGVARGYLNRPELTAAAFLPDPFSGEPGARLYRTGDAARLRGDGTVEFLGRIDDQVKIRGHRIEPQEIESVLKQDPEVEEAIVVAREQTSGGLHLIAFCVAPNKTPAGRQNIRGFLAARLPDYMIPSRFVFLDELPRTQNGKVDRQALHWDGTNRSAEARSYMAPRNAVEAKLAEIWSVMLGVARVGVEDDFFELGGDSILSIRVIARAKEAGLRFTPMELFQRKTIAGLAEVVRVEAVESKGRKEPAGPAVVGLSPDQAAEFLSQLGQKAGA